MNATNYMERLYKTYLKYRECRLEKQSFSQRIQLARSKVRGFFFISGAHRSGTTWLRRMIGVHPQVVTIAEARFVSPEADVNSWFSEKSFNTWADLPTVKYGTGILDRFNKNEFINYIKASMIEAVLLSQWKPHVRIIGDKTPLFYCQKVEELKRLFPSSKFINIIRDGRDVAVSSHFAMLREKNYSLYRDPKFGEEARKHFLDGKKNACPLFDDHSFMTVADAWAEAINGGKRARNIFGKNYFEVKYEDLHQKPNILKDIFKFLGVSPNRLLSNYCIAKSSFERLSGGRKQGEEDRYSFFRKGVVGDWRNFINGKYKKMYKEMNGRLLVELEYERDFNW